MVNYSSLGLFVCIWVLQPSLPFGAMLSTVSLPNYIFTGQAKSSKRLTSIVHILSTETDNCPVLDITHQMLYSNKNVLIIQKNDHL